MQKSLLYALLLAALSACQKDDERPVPQEDNTTLEVQVYNTLNWSTAQPAGTLTAGATVQLFKTRVSFNSNTPAYSATTDAGGKATFTGIDTGLYYIVARTTAGDNLLGATQQDGAYIGYMSDSLYQSQEEIANSPRSSTAAPGNFRFEDLNGDEMIDQNDKTELPAQSVRVVANATSTRRILIGKLDNRPSPDFTTEIEVNQAMQTSYTSLSKWHELQVAIDAVYTDDYGCTSLGVEWCTINGYTALIPANNTVTSFYRDGFQIISQLNRIIAYAGKVQDPEMQAAEKELAIARAKGLKGYVYLQLISYFGPVPLQDSIALPANAQRAASTAAAYQYTLGFLTAAAQGLASDDVIISDIACNALIAKLYLQQRNYTLSANYTTAIIADSATHTLVDTTAIFTQQINPEIIWKTSGGLQTTPIQSVFTRGQFLPEIRLTEVYLMHAEASLELNRITDAVASLNELRHRDNGPHITYSADPGFRETLRETLYTDWQRNMRTEGNRLPALVRWNRFMPVLAPLGFREFNTLLPIPQIIIDQYPGFTQNVGYH